MILFFHFDNCYDFGNYDPIYSEKIFIIHLLCWYIIRNQII